VSGKLAKELRQTRPFRSKEEEGFLNLGRTWEFLQKQVADCLKEWQLTPAQYNVLRILRGAGKDGVTCTQAGERMLSAEPDMTRLVDRMEARGLIRRERTKEDRRVVLITLADDGLELVNRIDGPLHQLLQKRLGHLGRQRLEQMIEILEALREPGG
jgi:DNA-binding MarR family transcriptional regulator